ncbi:MAG: efflux RND transporter periplasmic adaptor subunit [Opitutales bacterium]
MKASTHIFSILTLLCLTHTSWAADHKPIILSKDAASNLGVETQTVVHRDLRPTAFALGQIEAIPQNVSMVSTRVAGRVLEQHAFAGDPVEKGDLLATIETFQPGSPPPQISIYAPRSGLVIEHFTRIGEPVTVEQALFEIADLSSVYAIADIPESWAGKTVAGQTRAILQIPAIAKSGVEAELLRFGTRAHREHNAVAAYFVLDNMDFSMRPGMRAEFEVVVGEAKSVLTVPVESVQRDQGQVFVFVESYKLPHAYERVPVKTGLREGAFIEVETGLFPGDEVVTQGAYALRFAGGSSLSLKEALDAAHGHEHNEDGSEMTPEQRAAAKKAAQVEHGHSESHAGPMLTFFIILSAVLGLLLIVTLWSRGRRSDEGDVQ